MKAARGRGRGRGGARAVARVVADEVPPTDEEMSEILKKLADKYGEDALVYKPPPPDEEVKKKIITPTVVQANRGRGSSRVARGVGRGVARPPTRATATPSEAGERKASREKTAPTPPPPLPTRGVKEYRDGVYLGPIKMFKPHGKGSYSYKSGDRYSNASRTI